MGIDLARRDLDFMYHNLDKLYELVYRTLRDTVERIKRWEPGNLDDTIYLVESMMNVIEEQATFFIAKYQPLGPELFEAKSLIRVSYDLYRISRYCREINRVIEYMKCEGKEFRASKETVEAAELTLKMLEYSYRAYRDGDDSLRERVAEMDDRIDKTYTDTLKYVASVEKITPLEVADLLIVRHLERIADHSVYISSIKISR
ncbi:MAG: phosphate uptake regulator PhoU [Desulfurococcales archaeon]|nr:phosphate uptake regulator PhoU [Desulfurococcales archaeon]